MPSFTNEYEHTISGGKYVFMYQAYPQTAQAVSHSRHLYLSSDYSPKRTILERGKL